VSKKLFVLLMAAAMLVTFAGSAMALTTAHMAGATGATQGDCSGCHIPHKAAGAQRLFPFAVKDTARYGFMGGMCAEYCHAVPATLPDANAINTALYSPGLPGGSHGLTIARIPPQNALPNTLPYLTGGGVKDSLGGNAAFECTTCHNPHKNATADTSESLLQVDIDGICQVCHTNRGTGDGVWGAIYGETNNIGGVGASHPVGTDVYDDESQHDITGDLAADADSPIWIGLAGGAGTTAFDVPYGVSAAHNLGGHLLNGVAKGAAGAALTCQTCHSVHGNMLDTDADFNPDDGSPHEDLLAVGQGSHAVAGVGDPSAGDGNGQASNALCNGCHANTANALDAWNPGATLYSHPCDNQIGQLDMGVIVAPAGWPIGTHASVPTLNIAVICETCHDPHVASANSHILRQDELVICGTCHNAGAAPAGHHPVGNGRLTACGFTPGNIGDGDGDMECSDCHNGSGAHNWATAGGVGLDPDWEPWDNGRPTEPADGAMKVQALAVSKECMDCHNASTVATFSPTCTDRTNVPATLEERGEGSHFVGDFAATYLDGGLLMGAPFNAETADWNAGPGWAQSRFAGTAGAPVLVCESCHELEIDRKPAVNNALLLYDYVEMKNENDSEFCQGCHGATPGGGGTHPLTGDTVSKAVDAGRGTTTVITGAGTYANAAGAPNSAEYAAANVVNCDSCHQPHDTENAGGTFILEYGATGTPAFAALGAQAYYMNGIVINADSGSGVLHQELCLECHGY
jgi:predicted CXXCH cytochrome family protein